MTAVGNGSITSVPAGIDCGADCSEIYDYGTVVTLTANPAEGYELTGWSGACSGTNSTFVITVTEARSCTATFALKTHPLNVSTSGKRRGHGSELTAGYCLRCRLQRDLRPRNRRYAHRDGGRGVRLQRLVGPLFGQQHKRRGAR